MWSFLGSVWPFDLGPLTPPIENMEQLQAPRSPLLLQSHPTITFKGCLFAKRRAVEPTPTLYLSTSCAAIVDYCLLGRSSEMLNGKESLRLDPDSSEHLEVCVRMRRCNA